MRFQVGAGWPIGQFLIPAGVIIDIGDKEGHALSEFEKLAKGRIPPIDSCALDWDSAITMHRAYPDFLYRLSRHLSPYDEDMYQRVVSGGLNV